MATSSSSLIIMGEEEVKNYKAIIPARDFNSDSEFSESDMIDFFPIPQKKRRVKVPKVMVRGNGQNGGGDGRKRQQKWEAPARFVSKKLGLVMSSTFGSRKSPEKSCSKPKTGEKKSQASLDEERGGEKWKSLKQRVMAHRRQRGSLSFPSFLCRKTGLKLFRSKIKSGVNHARRTPKLAKVLSRRRRRAPKPGGEEEEEEEEEEKEDPEGGDAELCKKRILMGGKCRPLNSSGIYIYPNIQIKKRRRKRGSRGRRCRAMQEENSDGREVQATEYPNIQRKGEEENEDPEGEYARGEF